MNLRLNFFVTICVFFLSTPFFAVTADELTISIKDIQEILDTGGVLIVTGDTLHITAELDEEGEPLPIPGGATGLILDDHATVTFDVGAMIVIDTDAPITIADSMLTFSWSGKEKERFNDMEYFAQKLDERLQELLQAGEFDDMTEEEVAARLEELNDELTDELEKEHELNYIFSNFGGFVGNGKALDVNVDNSTITFAIAADAPAGTWYIDSYNIHIDGEATVNIEKGVVAARLIDDTIDGMQSGGNLVKTGAGTLLIGGSRHDESDGRESGLNTTGTLDIQEGTLVLAGDREFWSGDQEAEGSVTTTHHVGNVMIGNGGILDIATGAMLVITNTDDSIPDISIGKGGTLKVANSKDTGLHNLAKTLAGEQTHMFVNGGTVEIYAGNSNDVLLATSVDAELGGEGGTINVAEGITFESGAVTGVGDYHKIGKGIHVINGVDMTGDFYVTEGTVILNVTDRDDFIYPGWGIPAQNVNKIIIEGETAVLDLKEGIVLHLTHENEDEIDVVIADGGTLCVASSTKTLLFNSIRNDTNLLVDGGTVHFYKQEYAEIDELTGEPIGDDVLEGTTIHTFIGSGGGTISIARDVIFKGGDITALDGDGNVTKTGAGIHEVGEVHLGGGTYEVRGGTVYFTNEVVVGTLSNFAGTLIEMKEDGQDVELNHFNIAGEYHGGGRNLTVQKSGSITGTMTGVGDLTVALRFNLTGSGEHDIKTLHVDTEGTFDLNAGATLMLTNEDDGHDIDLKGALWIASVKNTNIAKSNGETVEFFLNGGKIWIYTPDAGADLQTHKKINTTLTLGSGGGTMMVDDGLTFETGLLTGVGDYKKVGGKGTHIINGMSIDGEFYVGDGKTILRDIATLEKHEAANVKVNAGTFEIANDVVFETNAIIVQATGIISSAGKVFADSVSMNNGTFELDTTLRLDDTDAMLTTKTLTLNNNSKIRVSSEYHRPGKYTFNHLAEITDGISETHLNALNTDGTALYRPKWSKTDNSLNLSVEILSVRDYVKEIGWHRENAVAVADAFDAHFYKEEEDENTPVRASAPGGADSPDKIREQLKALQDLPETQLESALRAAMAGELVGDAVRMVMSSPHRLVFQQLDAAPTFNSVSNRGMRGQMGTPSKSMRLWFTPYAQSEDGKSDSYTFDGYSLTRTGFLLGGDTTIANHIAAGLVFHYGSPHVKNDLGKINANDYTFGAYMKLPVYWQITLNAMIAGGVQQYTYKGAGGKATFDGSTIFGSLEMSRPFPILKQLNITPVVGLDFQGIGMDDLSASVLPGLDVPIKPDGLDTAMLRVGLRGTWSCLRTRVQYIRQVSGDDYMISAVTLGGNAPANVRSVQWGKDWVNAGLGYDFVQMRNFRCSVDYDFEGSKRTSSHLGSVSAVVLW